MLGPAGSSPGQCKTDSSSAVSSASVAEALRARLQRRAVEAVDGVGVRVRLLQQPLNHREAALGGRQVPVERGSATQRCCTAVTSLAARRAVALAYGAPCFSRRCAAVASGAGAATKALVEGQWKRHLRVGSAQGRPPVIVAALLVRDLPPHRAEFLHSLATRERMPDSAAGAHPASTGRRSFYTCGHVGALVSAVRPARPVVRTGACYKQLAMSLRWLPKLCMPQCYASQQRLTRKGHCGFAPVPVANGGEEQQLGDGLSPRCDRAVQAVRHPSGAIAAWWLQHAAVLLRQL